MANPKSKSRRKLVVFSSIGLALVALSLVIFFRKREVAITVQTEKVARRSLTELVVANGRIQPVLQVVINPEVSGEITELPVKEGQPVKKGDLLLKIKPANYLASRNSAQASHLSALASKSLALANLHKAEVELKRMKELFKEKLVSDSQFLDAETSFEVMKASFDTSLHQADQARASLARAEDDLAKTTIHSPIDGTVTKLRSQVGERVVGTAMMAGTEIMTVANLEEMEARVDIGEIDVVLIALGQQARLEVDAYQDRKFTGIVSEIANAAKGSASADRGGGGGSQQQEATKFEVKIRVKEKEIFRPGMSVSAEIETRSRTNVLTVPIQSVTTRLPKDDASGSSAISSTGPRSNKAAGDVKTPSAAPAAASRSGKSGENKKPGEAPKPSEVVFVMENDRVKAVPVKRGISDEANVEITEGVQEGQEVISGGYKAISRELEDGKKVKIGPAKLEPAKEKS